MQCNKSHFGKPYQDTLTRLLGNSKKTKTNSLWIVLNYAMWNSLIFYHWCLIPFSASVSVSVSVSMISYPDSRFLILVLRCFSWIMFWLSTRKRNSDWKRNLVPSRGPFYHAPPCRWPKGSRPLRTRLHNRDSWGRGWYHLWYWEHAHSLVSAYSDSFSPPEPLGSIFTIL